MTQETETEHDTDPAPAPVEVRSLEGRELLRQWRNFANDHLRQRRDDAEERGKVLASVARCEALAREARDEARAAKVAAETCVTKLAGDIRAIADSRPDLGEVEEITKRTLLDAELKHDADRWRGVKGAARKLAWKVLAAMATGGALFLAGHLCSKLFHW